MAQENKVIKISSETGSLDDRTALIMLVRLKVATEKKQKWNNASLVHRIL